MNRALLVGINNYPSDPLRGCLNDITDMAAFLVNKCGFQKNEIRMLADERATKIAIVERLGWLLTGLTAGDRILFHFSGHGAQLPTRNPQGEVDGLDEVICPVDFNWSEETALRDKELGKIFAGVPAGVLFTWVCDSCHSEDNHKLMSKKDERARTMNIPVDIAWRIEAAAEKKLQPLGIAKAAGSANVVLISGCKSNEESADAKINNRFNGAMTYFLLSHLNNGGFTQPLTEVVNAVNTLLDQNQYSQNPQLCGSEALKLRPYLQ